MKHRSFVATIMEKKSPDDLFTNRVDLINDVKNLDKYQERPLAAIVLGIFLFLCTALMIFAIVKGNMHSHALMDLEHHLFMETGSLAYESQLLLQCGLMQSPLTKKNFWRKMWHAFRTEQTVVRGCVACA